MRKHVHALIELTVYAPRYLNGVCLGNHRSLISGMSIWRSANVDKPTVESYNPKTTNWEKHRDDLNINLNNFKTEVSNIELTSGQLQETIINSY